MTLRLAIVIACVAALVVVAIAPSDGLAVLLGVPLRRISGELAAMLLTIGGGAATFDRYLLEIDGVTALLVVPECSGLRKFILLSALALLLATRRRLSTTQSLALLVIAAAFAIGANALRLVGIALFVPNDATRHGAGAIVHELVGLVPLAVAAGGIVFVAKNLFGAHPARRVTVAPTVGFAFGVVAVSLSNFDDEFIPLERSLRAGGGESRVVDARVEERDDGTVSIATGREVWGDVAGKRIVFERVDANDGSTSWPDVAAYRFAARFEGAPRAAHHVVTR